MDGRIMPAQPRNRPQVQTAVTWACAGREHGTDRRRDRSAWCAPGHRSHIQHRCLIPNYGQLFSIASANVSQPAAKAGALC